MSAKATTKPTAKGLQRKDLTGLALRTFFSIADAWGLKEQEQMYLLGLESRLIGTIHEKRSLSCMNGVSARRWRHSIDS